MSRSADRLPQLAQERVVVADLPPAAPDDAGCLPVDGPTHVPPAAAVAEVEAREVVVVAGGEGSWAGGTRLERDGGATCRGTPATIAPRPCAPSRSGSGGSRAP